MENVTSHVSYNDIGQVSTRAPIKMMRPTYEEFQLPEEYTASDNNKKLELKFDQADNTSLSSLKDSGYRSVSEVLYSFYSYRDVIEWPGLVDTWDLESLSYICG